MSLASPGNSATPPRAIGPTDQGSPSQPRRWRALYIASARDTLARRFNAGAESPAPARRALRRLSAQDAGSAPPPPRQSRQRPHSVPSPSQRARHWPSAEAPKQCLPRCRGVAHARFAANLPSTLSLFLPLPSRCGCEHGLRARAPLRAGGSLEAGGGAHSIVAPPAIPASR